LDKDQKYTIGYSFKNKMGISVNNFVLLELIKDGSIMYTRKLQATEATTFDYTAPATGEYTWRMRSSSIGTTTTQPLTYSLDNLSIFYSYPYTVENCDNLADGYRFGFNTQEKDDEVYGAGNLNTAMFWEYDTRIGRRWNVDPKSNIWESEYAVFGGNPILNTDVNGDSWFKNKSGDIRWDNSQKKSIRREKEKWSNIGNTLNIAGNSYISKPNDFIVPPPLNELGAGNKLTTLLSITGNYDNNGDFSGFTYSYDKVIGKSFNIDMLQGVEYPGKPNTSSSSGTAWDGKSPLLISAHVTTPDIETVPLKIAGRNVDVNQDISVGLGAGGRLNVSITHGSYPSLNMFVWGNNINSTSYLYRYREQSFILSHAPDYFKRMSVARLMLMTSPNLQSALDIYIVDLHKRMDAARQRHIEDNNQYKKTNKANFKGYND
jgi:hypothetical protein